AVSSATVSPVAGSSARRGPVFPIVPAGADSPNTSPGPCTVPGTAVGPQRRRPVARSYADAVVCQVPAAPSADLDDVGGLSTTTASVNTTMGRPSARLTANPVHAAGRRARQSTSPALSMTE